MYKENPKTAGSGIICAIPQKGTCPNNCPDCFFQSGRSYLEPLEENLPNMPPVELTKNKVVRINDGNDSNINKKEVIEKSKQYEMKFYNTSIPDLSEFDAPVVLTVNPGKNTDNMVNTVWDGYPDIKKLMFVRFRTNTWNLKMCDIAVEHYTSRNISVILTFMAYYDQASIPEEHKKYYVERKRTLNTYWAITTAGWEMVMNRYKYNLYVYSCGKVEGELGKTGCRYCGNCLREFFAVSERMKG